MTSPRERRGPDKALVWGLVPHGVPSLLKDLPIFLATFSVFYAFLALTRYWLTPVSSQTEIDLHPSALPKYLKKSESGRNRRRVSFARSPVS